MATSSFFTPLVVRPEDENAWIKAFTSKNKIKINKSTKSKTLSKSETAAFIKQYMGSK